MLATSLDANPWRGAAYLNFCKDFFKANPWLVVLAAATSLPASNADTQMSQELPAR
ncbi:MAG: hypothetical protein ACJAYX_001855 [Planctomycetota bacterium]|jgi:hypothetical protein